MRIGRPADKHLPKCFRIHLLGDAWAAMETLEFDSERWSLPAAFAWILFRDEQKVTQYMHDKLSIMDIISDVIKDPQVAENITAEAIKLRDQLIERLESGKLKAQGLAPTGNRLQPIQSSEWLSVENLNEFIVNIPHNAVGKWDEASKRGVILFKQVTLARADVIRAWRANKSEKIPKKNYSEKEILDFLSSKINENDGYIAQKEAEILVRERFPGYPRDEVRKHVKLLTGNDKRGPRGPRKIKQK